MKKIDEYEQEIAEDLLNIINKIAEWKQNIGIEVIPDETIIHISYAIEYLTGEFGVTDEEIQKWDPEFFRKKDN